jgi:transcriptional regulator with XRE-family HTH domain
MTSAELIRDARQRHGLSQRRLALRAGASQAWISRVEQGKISPSIESLDRLLLVMGETLNLRAERAFGDEEDADWQQIQRDRPMAERLERAFDAAGFAAELHGAASSR